MPPAFVPSHITWFGAAHTAVSMLPVLIGLYLYIAKGTIDLKTGLAKIYWVLSLIGAISALFIFHHGGFGPGHAVSIAMIVVLLLAALVAWVMKTKTRTIEIILTSLSYFFLWFFVTTETLTRFPVAKPFASDPAAPSLIPVRVGMLIIMTVGIVLQIRAEKKLSQ